MHIFHWQTCAETETFPGREGSIANEFPPGKWRPLTIHLFKTSYKHNSRITASNTETFAIITAPLSALSRRHEFLNTAVTPRKSRKWTPYTYMKGKVRKEACFPIRNYVLDSVTFYERLICDTCPPLRRFDVSPMRALLTPHSLLSRHGKCKCARERVASILDLGFCRGRILNCCGALCSNEAFVVTCLKNHFDLFGCMTSNQITSNLKLKLMRIICNF